MNVSIRQMQKEDIASVQEVAKISWHDTYEDLIPIDVQNRFLNSAYSNESMFNRLKHSHLFVAEVDEKIVGFANFSPVQKDGKIELGAIYLNPAYQGKGIGTSLLAKGIKMDGVKKLIVNVEKENEKGMNFYHAKGFEFVSEHEEEFDGHLLKTVCLKLTI